MALKENNHTNNSSLDHSDLIELLSKKTIELLDAMNKKIDGQQIQILRSEVIQIQEAVQKTKIKK